MAAMTTAEREQCRAEFVREWFHVLRQLADLDVDELLLLVEDVDNWLDSQTTEANQAIRVSIRGKASTGTKFAALAYAALKRARKAAL